MAFLSAAALLLQVTLTRVFSIAQFYHFAFLIVSLALLGFGASGSLLALFPRLRKRQFGAWYAVGFTVTAVLAYLFLNHKPFDSYSIAWDRTQVYLLIGNLLGLAVPFAFAGAVIVLLLSEEAAHAGKIYGANLVGSALGAILAPVIIDNIGSERAVLLAVTMGAASGVILAEASGRAALRMSVVVLVASLSLFIVFPRSFEIQPSQYKNLSLFRLNPQAEIVNTRQNAYSRLDVVESSTIHSAQGMSLRYFGELPPQVGLLIDGDNLLPVPDTHHANPLLAESLPAAVAYTVRPNPNVLILKSGGGMDAWAAMQNGAVQVRVIEPNKLVYEALTSGLNGWFDLENLQIEHNQIRSFAQQHLNEESPEHYDIVLLSLADNYRPISSGAFTLTEDYTLTVEAFRAYLDLAGDDGLLVLNRWLQSPPSESLRALAIILEALDTTNPLSQIVVFRSFQVATFIVKPTPFTADETEALLEAVTELRYDLVLAPEMPEDMINQYARLETPIYHETFLALVNTPNRDDFYEASDFRIDPPTDDKPFFFHFFRWSQTPDIIENLGRRWQPFGGSGYFVLLALLLFAIAAAVIFVALPVALRPAFRRGLVQSGAARSMRILGYYTAIGLAFLLIEIAMIQQYMLVLGQPTQAVAAVIGALLFFSGLGSSNTHRFHWRLTIFLLAFLLVVYPLIIDSLRPLLLTLPQTMLVPVVVLLIAPVGFLMGMPFARGITVLENEPNLIPWAWAINGSASVITAVLAAILALSLGFTLVLLIGGGLYAAAGLLAGFAPIQTSIASSRS